MPQVYNIPLKSNSPQSLTITLAGIVYNLVVKWNDVFPSWVLDIYDSNQALLIGGLPLVTGVNLLGQFAYIGIPGELIVQSDFDPDAVPDFVTLGVTGHLYYISA